MVVFFSAFVLHFLVVWFFLLRQELLCQMTSFRMARAHQTGRFLGRLSLFADCSFAHA